MSIFLKCIANYFYTSLSPCYVEHDSFLLSTHCLSGNNELMGWTYMKLLLFKERKSLTSTSTLQWNSYRRLYCNIPSPKYRKSHVKISSRAIQVLYRQLCACGKSMTEYPKQCLLQNRCGFVWFFVLTNVVNLFHLPSPSPRIK